MIVPDAAAWRRWLAANHREQAGVWLVLAKKGTTEPTSLTYEQALEEALCHGWIDGRSARRDEQPTGSASRRGERAAPGRGATSRSPSGWAGEGRMHQPGIAEVERAKADGRWRGPMRAQRDIEIPTTCRGARRRAGRAGDVRDAHSQNRYAILYRLTSAKRAETRARRLQQYVAMLARGETIHPQKRTLAS